MRTFAEFQIIGRVGKVTPIGAVLRVAVAAEYKRRDDGGELKPNTYWNEITLFGEREIEWVKGNVNTGDLVHVRGTLRQTKYEKDGQTVYGTTLAAEAFDRLAARTPATA
jgi:single-stranded DNA-binding protein